MRTLGHMLARLAALLPGIVYAIPLLFAYLLWGRRGTFRWDQEAFRWELRADSWFRRKFYMKWGGTTMGLVIMTKPDPTDNLYYHECRHVEQFQAQGLVGLMVGGMLAVMGLPTIGLIVWLVMPALSYGAAGTIAWLRGGKFYRSNLFEAAAYDAAKLEKERQQ